MSPRACVCVCTWQRAKYLRLTLRSLAATPAPGVRYVVVDNASTDETAEVVAEFPLFELVRNPANVGMVGNWNRALALADAGLVAVFHDDDEYEPGAVEALLEAIEAAPGAAFVHAGVTYVDPDGAAIGEPPLQPGGLRPGREVAWELLRGGRCPFFAPTVVARAEAVRRAGSFDETFRLAADLDMWARLCLFGDVAYVSRRLVRYRKHPGSGTERSNVIVYAEEVRRVRERLADALAPGAAGRLERLRIAAGFHATVAIGMGARFGTGAAGPDDAVNAAALGGLLASTRRGDRLLARVLLLPPVRAALRGTGAMARRLLGRGRGP